MHVGSGLLCPVCQAEAAPNAPCPNCAEPLRLALVPADAAGAALRHPAFRRHIDASRERYAAAVSIGTPHTPEPWPINSPAEVARFRAMVKDRHAPCPVCSYNLRDRSDPRCPECGYAPRLAFGMPEPSTGRYEVVLVRPADVARTMEPYKAILLIVGVILGLAAVALVSLILLNEHADAGVAVVLTMIIGLIIAVATFASRKRVRPW